MIDEIKQVAVHSFLGVLKAVDETKKLNSNGGGKNYYHMEIDVNFDGIPRKLYLHGVTYPLVEDGHVVAILNPSKSLIDATSSSDSVCMLGNKDYVSQKCEYMVDLWIDAYKDNKHSVMTEYKSRKYKGSKSVTNH